MREVDANWKQYADVKMAYVTDADYARLKAEVERLTNSKDILTLELKAITCEMEMQTQTAIRENNLGGWTCNHEEQLFLFRKRFDEVRSQLNAAKGVQS